MIIKKKFSAVIEKGISGGAFVSIPFDVEKVFGQKRVKVKALIDGEPYRGLLVRMKTKNHILGILKEIQSKIKKDVGDKVEIIIEEDIELRIINVPKALQNELKKNPKARDNFEKLSYTHKKEYVRWIEGAKKPETRQNRITKMMETLLKGKE